MSRTILYSLVAFSLLLSAGCGGDDDPVAPAAPAELALTLNCNNGLTELKLTNNGGPMTADEMFEAVFEDGERDTLYLRVGSADSVSCTLSNIHGTATVTNQSGNLTATSDNCIDGALADALAGFNLQSRIPSPLTSIDTPLCTYTVYLTGMTYSGPTYQLIPTSSGLTVRYTFSNIRGNIRAEGSSFLCPDLAGNLTITSLVSESQIIIDEGGNPEVSLGQTSSTINGLNVSIGGLLGGLADFLASYFLSDNFAGEIEVAIESLLNALSGSDLESLVIVSSGCGE